jgi:hypothetical protein
MDFVRSLFWWCFDFQLHHHLLAHFWNQRSLIDMSLQRTTDILLLGTIVNLGVTPNFERFNVLTTEFQRFI